MGFISPVEWEARWRTDVIACLWVLAPGTASFTVAKILQNDLQARGHLNHCMSACTVVLVTMLALDVVLIPTHGAWGAAVASSIAYGASAVYTLVAYARCGGAGIGQCLVPRPSDWLYVREIWEAVREKIWGRRS